jgi:hypothetical protein
VARGFVSIRRSTAGPLEVGAIVALTIGVWRLALGWDWAAPSHERGRGTVAQTPLDWLTLAVVAVAAVGWLALRGRAVLGFVVVCVPVVVLSGWRLAAGDVLDWPSQVAALVFGLSVTCMPVALIGSWLRRRVSAVVTDAVPSSVIRPRNASPDDDQPDGADAAGLPRHGADAAGLPPDGAEAAGIPPDGADAAGVQPDGAGPSDDVDGAAGETADD